MVICLAVKVISGLLFKFRIAFEYSTFGRKDGKDKKVRQWRIFVLMFYYVCLVKVMKGFLDINKYKCIKKKIYIFSLHLL